MFNAVSSQLNCKGHKMGVCLLVGLLGCFFTIGSACTSGRLYIGTVNETQPDNIHRNGIYILHNTTFMDFPVYKHELRNEYLYYIHGNLFGGYWAIGPQIGGTDAGLSVQTQNAMTPEAAREVWYAWDKRSQSWSPAENVGVTCVDQDFMTCSAGEIVIHGLSGSNAVQRRRMGAYKMTNLTHSLRAVYQQDSYPHNYLFYLSGLWMIGPTVGVFSGGLFTKDQAWRPEYITKPWIVFNGFQFAQENNIEITCRGIVANATPSYSEELEDTEAAPPNGEPSLPEDLLRDVCQPNPCLNGGQCQTNRRPNTYFCTCENAFFGPNCQTEMRCGAAPSIDYGQVVGGTGMAFLDTAFYMCDTDRMMGRTISHGAVCQADGEWSSPPPCQSPINLGTPIHHTVTGNRKGRLRPGGSRELPGSSLEELLEYPIRKESRPVTGSQGSQSSNEEGHIPWIPMELLQNLADGQD